MRYRISQNQFALTADFETEKFNIAISGKYVDAFRTVAEQEQFPNKVNSNFIIDLSAKYHLSQKVSLMSNIVNLMDKVCCVKSSCRIETRNAFQHQFWNNGAVIKLCHLFNSKKQPIGFFFLFCSMYIQEIIALRH
jgi:outer membrane receptor for ferrienterochelin and colicin